MGIEQYQWIGNYWIYLKIVFEAAEQKSQL